MTKYQSIRNYVLILMGKNGRNSSKINFCDAMNMLASFIYMGAENFHGSATRGLFLGFRNYVWDRMGHGLGLYSCTVDYCNFMNIANDIMSICCKELGDCEN